jgi:exosortase C (VPDSG-CTERM-specific)
MSGTLTERRPSENGTIEGRSGTASGAWREWSRSERLRIGGLVGYAALITLLFIEPLVALFAYAAQSDLHSHIPLIPLITGYLLYSRSSPRAPAYRTSPGGALVAAAIGSVALAAAIRLDGRISTNDYLGLMTFAFLGVIVAGWFLFLGSRWVAYAVFPIAFLIFMIPLPDQVAMWLETASVRASADVAAFLFRMTGTPLLRDGTVFALPGIVIQVARECSGIHSSWVLFITSILASHLFLRTRWRRLGLVAFTIPLAVLRNGFRILVIGLLCVHVGPQMIDSAIHRHGGPFFFALSLVPLFLLMSWLRSGE